MQGVEIPAFAGMTLEGAGMTLVCAGMIGVSVGMTLVCAGMMGVCVGMTLVCVGMNRMELESPCIGNSIAPSTLVHGILGVWLPNPRQLPA